MPKHFERTANIRSNLQISLLSSNQTNTTKVFLQLGRICFRILLQQSENFSEFCKVLSLFTFRNMIVGLPKSQTRHPTRARAPLTLPHGFFDERGFTKFFPSSHLLSRSLAKRLQVLIYDNFVSADFEHVIKTTNQERGL